MAAYQQAVGNEFVDRFAHGNPADSGKFGDVAFRRQRIAMAERASAHGFLECAAQLDVERAGAGRLQALQGKESGEVVGHAAPLCPLLRSFTASSTAPCSASPFGLTSREL